MGHSTWSKQTFPGVKMTSNVFLAKDDQIPRGTNSREATFVLCCCGSEKIRSVSPRSRSQATLENACFKFDRAQVSHWRGCFFIASSAITADDLRFLLQSLSSHAALARMVQFDLREQSRPVQRIVDDGHRKEFLLHFRRKVRSPEVRSLWIEVEIYYLGLFEVPKTAPSTTPVGTVMTMTKKADIWYDCLVVSFLKVVRAPMGRPYCPHYGRTVRSVCRSSGGS